MLSLVGSVCLTQRISGVFPNTQGDARAVLAKIEYIRDNDERSDLQTSAKLYAGALDRRIPSMKEGGMKPEAAPSKPDKPERVEKVEKVEKVERKTEKADKSDKADRSEPKPEPTPRAADVSVKSSDRKRRSDEAADVKPVDKPVPSRQEQHVVKLASDREKHVVKLASDTEPNKPVVKLTTESEPGSPAPPPKKAVVAKVKLLLCMHVNVSSCIVDMFVVCLCSRTLPFRRN